MSDLVYAGEHSPNEVCGCGCKFGVHQVVGDDRDVFYACCLVDHCYCEQAYVGEPVETLHAPHGTRLVPPLFKGNR